MLPNRMVRISDAVYISSDNILRILVIDTDIELTYKTPMRLTEQSRLLTEEMFFYQTISYAKAEAYRIACEINGQELAPIMPREENKSDAG